MNKESHLETTNGTGRAVREALAKGKLGGKTVLKPRMTLRIREIGFEHLIEGEIGVG